MDRISIRAIFSAFLRLGLTSFGGPVAHLAYFHRAFVVRRRWISEGDYAELIGLCQFLPGPSSSQVGIGIGMAQRGWPGAVAAWIGFTLPSAVFMTILGICARYYREAIPPWLIHGLILVAVPVVAQAVWQMPRQLCPDWPRRIVAAAATIAFLTIPMVVMQPVVLGAAGLIGYFAFADRGIATLIALPQSLHRRLAPFLLGCYFIFLRAPIFRRHFR